jgi:hypothetical protein
MHPPEHSPDHDEPESGLPLAIPVPPDLAEACGYPLARDARYVGFHWIPAGDEVVYDDGIRSGTGQSYTFLAFRRHPSVEPLLEPFNLGYSGCEADHCLILDRQEARAYIAPLKAARTFLREQHPPPPELSPYEQFEAERQIEETYRAIQQALSEGWQEVKIDPQEIFNRLEEQRRTTARMLDYLNQWRTERQ